MYILKEDEFLTKKAKDIFGKKLVKSAYYVEYYFEHKKDDIDHREYVLKNLEMMSERNNEDDGEIEQDGMDIVIDFNNNKSVFFHNSEWGSMSSYSHIESTNEKI